MQQRLAIEDGFEYEMAVEFDDAVEFEDAAADALDGFGGWIATLEVERRSLLLDTADRSLSAKGITIAVVLHSGLNGPAHKIVTKFPCDIPAVRRENIIRVYSPENGWARQALTTLSDVLQSRAEIRIEPNDFVEVGQLRQRRIKRTVVPDRSLPVYLSFDYVRAYDASGSVLLGERMIMEAESVGSDPAEVVEGSRVPDVQKHFTDSYRATNSAVSKRGWMQALGAAASWRIDAPCSDTTTIPQSTRESNESAKRYAVFLQDVVLADVQRRLPESDPKASYNEAMSFPDRSRRHRAHRAHFDALAVNSEDAIEGLRVAVSRPAVLPFRRAFATRAASDQMLRTTFAAFESGMPALHQIHGTRAAGTASPYTLADVQVAQSPSSTLTFEGGRRTVVDVLARFQGAEAVEQIFDESRVDISGTGAKGAAATFVGVDGRGWVSMPWNGTVNSLFTLAHETMHALHIDANVEYQRLPSLLRESVARVAEFELLKSGKVDDREHWVQERWRSQFFRPAAQSAFEVRLRNGSVPLHPESMRAACESGLRALYGNAVQIRSEDGFEWVKARHLFRPFGLLEYSMSFLIGSVLHHQLSASDSIGLLFEAKSIDDLGSRLSIDFTLASTYETVIEELIASVGDPKRSGL